VCVCVCVRERERERERERLSEESSKEKWENQEGRGFTYFWDSVYVLESVTRRTCGSSVLSDLYGALLSLTVQSWLRCGLSGQGTSAHQAEAQTDHRGVQTCTF
jgi:hypothetical protein